MSADRSVVEPKPRTHPCQRFALVIPSNHLKHLIGRRSLAPDRDPALPETGSEALTAHTEVIGDQSQGGPGLVSALSVVQHRLRQPGDRLRLPTHPQRGIHR
ncbi:hypothetical protein [Brevibacterium aurantiacum]|nr:hypothetical protein [Brevibacterium aurantiacum]